MLQCNPVPKYWDDAIPGKCLNRGAYVVSTSSIVLATDLLILIMPTWILHDLRMPFGRKIMVIAFLSFGVAVTIVGAVRTSVLVKVFVIGKAKADPTYEVSYILSNIETGLAIIGTCGPTIKHLLSCCVPILRTSDETNDRGYPYPPTIGSLSTKRTRPHTMGIHTRLGKDMVETCSDRKDSLGKDRSGEDLELTKLGGGGESGRRSTSSDENLVITKTVAWKVEASQRDCDSTHEQTAKLPRTVF